MELKALLKKAEKDYQQKFKELKIADKQYQDALFKLEAPKLKPKYEGKYFVGENKMGDKTWPVYLHCIKLKSIQTAICTSFEQSYWGELTTHIKREQALEFCKKEISKEEFDKQKKTFIKSVNQLNFESNFN